MFNKLYESIKKYIKDNYKFLICIILIIFLCTYELPYVIYKNGGIINLSNRVDVDKKYSEKGSFNMSYVTAIKGTIPAVLLSYVIPDWDLFPLNEISNESSYEETLVIGKEYLDEGIDNAIIAAFQRSDYKIKIIKEINKVIFISPQAKTDIEVGDIVLKINNKDIDSFDNMRKYINTLKEKEEVEILVSNKDKEYKRHATLYKDKDDLLKVGVAFKTTYKYETEIPVTVRMKNNESGSSGGLMMSLAIYNALTKEDITNGLKIAGTGSIKNDGTVEEIGGVKYKVLASEKNKADIFFCPVENYKEAIKIKKKRKLKIKIVKVHTIDDAIDYLTKKESN